MDCILIEGEEKDIASLSREIVALKKQIIILETANQQLKREVRTYKDAYERWSNMFVFRAIKKVMGR